MSRKSLGPDQRVSRDASFNQLVKQLEDKDSLINYLPEDIRLSALELPDNLINLDEDAILKELRTRYRYTPSTTIEALRNNFWMEYDRVQASKTENVMNMTHVYLGVCSREYFHKVTREIPYQFAFILTRSPQYEAVQAGLLTLSTRKIRDILSIPIKTKDGYQDPKIIELILKAAAMVDLRNKGGYINRSETKNMTLIEQNTKHSYAGMFNAASNDGTKTAQQIQQDITEKLAILEREAMDASPPPEPKFTRTPNEDVIVEAEYKEVKSDGQSSV